MVLTQPLIREFNMSNEVAENEFNCLENVFKHLEKYKCKFYPGDQEISRTA